MRVHRLLALARKTGNPIIEGDQVTWVWQGPTAPALIDDFHNWDDELQKMARAGNNLWSYSISLPEDAYLEYAFLDERTGERLPDPLNSNRIENGVDNYNHFFYMPKGKPTSFAQTQRGIPRGA